jgi:hypothetical protein
LAHCLHDKKHHIDTERASAHGTKLQLSSDKIVEHCFSDREWISIRETMIKG